MVFTLTDDPRLVGLCRTLLRLRPFERCVRGFVSSGARLATARPPVLGAQFTFSTRGTDPPSTDLPVVAFSPPPIHRCASTPPAFPQVRPLACRSRCSFRPRAFSAPRRLPPHISRRFVAPCYRSWGSSRCKLSAPSRASEEAGARPRESSEVNPILRRPEVHRRYSRDAIPFEELPSMPAVPRRRGLLPPCRSLKPRLGLAAATNPLRWWRTFHVTVESLREAPRGAGFPRPTVKSAPRPPEGGEDPDYSGLRRTLSRRALGRLRGFPRSSSP